MDRRRVDQILGGSSAQVDPALSKLYINFDRSIDLTDYVKIARTQHDLGSPKEHFDLGRGFRGL